MKIICIWVLLLGGMKMNGYEQNLSHTLVEENQSAIKQRIESKGDLPYATVSEQLALLDELASLRFTAAMGIRI